MSFLSKLSKPKYKGKVGHVPMFGENGELIDSGAEAGGGSLTPEALSEVLEGSDSVVVDMNEEGDKLRVSLDKSVDENTFVTLSMPSFSCSHTLGTETSSIQIENATISIPYEVFKIINPENKFSFQISRFSDLTTALKDYYVSRGVDGTSTVGLPIRINFLSNITTHNVGLFATSYCLIKPSNKYIEIYGFANGVEVIMKKTTQTNSQKFIVV